MIASNISQLILVTFIYLLIFVIIPFWLRGNRFSGEHVFDKLVSTFIYSHVIIITCVLCLSLIGIYSRFTLTSLLLLVCIAYRFFFKREQSVAAIKNMNDYFHEFVEGYHKPHIIFKNFFRMLERFFKSLKQKITNPIGLLFTLAIFGFAIYWRSYHSINNMFFATSDMYLHTEWLKFMTANQPFIGGVYPFGIHAVIAAISDVMGINPITVVRMFGPIIGILILLSLYYLMRQIIKSQFAINSAISIYVVTSIFHYWAVDRHFLATPQELALIFLYLAAYYFYRFLKEKEIADLITFSSAAALTLMIHPFIFVLLGALCAFIFIVCITYINKETILQLVIVFTCVLLIAALPLVWGLIKGIPLNDSFNWAVSVVVREDNAAAVENVQSNNLLMNLQSFFRQLRSTGVIARSDEYTPFLDSLWFYPFLFAAGIGLLSPLIFYKKRHEYRIFTAISLYSLLLFILFALAILDIFYATEYLRLYAFFIYSVPIVLAIPLQLLHNLLNNTKVAMRFVHLMLVATLSLSGIYYVFSENRIMSLPRVVQGQHNGSVIAYYEIVNNFPKNRWLIVSSSKEYTLVLHEGFHYQIVDFIMDMHHFNEDTLVLLDAENIFFIIEKRPTMYFVYKSLEDWWDFAELDPEDVYRDLETEFGAIRGTNLHHINQNYQAYRVLQAHAYAWAREYMRFFPREMSIFYEDDDIIVFRLQQDIYALQNFAIPYAGNMPNPLDQQINTP